MLSMLLSCQTTLPTDLYSAESLCIPHVISCEVAFVLVTFSLSCLPTFLQDGRDCFLLACKEGHQEIVCELLKKDKVDRNVVDNVRN